MKKILLALTLCFSIFILSSFVVDEKNNSKKKDFYMFLSHFEKTTTPYGISIEDLPVSDLKKGQIYNSNVSALPTEFIPNYSKAKFSRMGPPSIKPIARFYPSEDHIAVVYSSDLRYGIYKTYQLIVYDFNGNILTKNNKGQERSILIASINSQQINTCNINDQGEIIMETYKIDWKENIDEKGFQDNEILSYTKLAEKITQIEENGLIKDFRNIQDVSLITKA